MTVYDDSLKLHELKKGKIEVSSKVPVKTKEDLSLAYTPGVAEPCRAIAKNKEDVFRYTIKQNTVAVISDGSAVLGLGNIGAEASIPVMEGKALLFKEFAGIDAFPICISTQETGELISIIKNIAPVFGGINLEDISAPRCFFIENALQDLGIPVMHDDQHGTAVVVLAALMNASKVVGKPFTSLRIVVNGAGAAGTAIAKLLSCSGVSGSICYPVKEVVVCDSKGIISKTRTDLNNEKRDLANATNHSNREGSLQDALEDADVFIGVSVANSFKKEWVSLMSKDAIILAMANPTPEIAFEEAVSAGAGVVGTGRSDYPNQINNVLAFPGIFKGALDAKATRITVGMKLAAAKALAESIKPTKDQILPPALDKSIAGIVAAAVKKQAIQEGVIR
ncbi:NADP-dependent malic enzyme [Candidatus Micrarchaeota archaeon]|nr:NADP-dependent malic enzyme [Candidatus Micrarchaeota archaeon]